MKTVEIVIFLTGLGLWTVGASLHAGDVGGSEALTANAPAGNPGPTSNTHSTEASRGHILLPAGNGHLLYAPDGVPDSSWLALPSDVQALVAQFQHDRTDYIVQRDKLLEQMGRAVTAQRARIRAQLAVLRDKWLEEQRQLRSETREQLQELKAQLMNNRDEQLRDADALGDGRHNKR